MNDFWFAECNPCQWQEKHATQDDAIRAAEDHVFSQHRNVPPAVRGREYMGHVQNRTDNAIAVLQPSDVQLPPGATTPENLYDPIEIDMGTEHPVVVSEIFPWEPVEKKQEGE